MTAEIVSSLFCFFYFTLVAETWGSAIIVINVRLIKGACDLQMESYKLYRKQTCEKYYCTSNLGVI